jgi:hypothetical protein
MKKKTKNAETTEFAEAEQEPLDHFHSKNFAAREKRIKTRRPICDLPRRKPEGL